LELELGLKRMMNRLWLQLVQVSRTFVWVECHVTNPTVLGTGEQMAHTMIASKAVDRMFGDEDELMGLQKAIEQDFMGNPTYHFP
jgi:hypothetical protein